MEKRPDLMKNIWPPYKRLIKGGASLNGMTMMEFTRALAQDPEFEKIVLRKKTNEKKIFQI